MFITTFISGPLETNSYLITCPATSVAVIVDPAPSSAEKISAYLTKHHLSLQKIILTHSHWDHIADVPTLLKTYPVPVSVHALDVPNLERPGVDLLPCPFIIEGVKPDELLDDHAIIMVGSVQIKVIHTPGHTPGGVCFYCEEQGFLISGDTLFKGSIGNISFPTSVPHLMWDSLKKLSLLPPETIVYTGHGSTTTIGKERWLAEAEKVFG